MRLLDFVKQHDTVRFPPHRLAELSTLFVPDVARRRADQPGDGVFLHVLGHVEANHCVFVVEKEFSQRAAQFSFPHSSWAEEINEPIGRFSSCRPARARRTALETAVIASRCPITRSLRRSS